MKRKLAIVAVTTMAMVLALGLAGCSSGSSSSTAPSTEESTAESTSTEESTESTGVANPWSDAASAEEAAKGAGIDGFIIGEGDEISLGTIANVSYSYMDGIAEAQFPIAAVDMTIRKGLASAAAEEGDISGDYTEYKNTWTENFKGLEVTCFGNRKGEATKTIWTVDDYAYAILAYGAGGDTDFGLSVDDLSSLVNSIQ